MKRRMKLFAAVAVILAVAAGLTACAVPAALDVVGSDSVRAFGEVLEALPAENSGSDDIEVWRMAAPDGGAWFEWDNQTMEMVVDAEPFIKAGLDLSLLENANTDNNTIVYLTPEFNMLNQNEQATPIAQFEKDTKALRNLIGYHMELDHYNISLADGGAMFEWAKDMAVNGTTNEVQNLDIVFVLDPEPLIAAGVDPAKVEGWSLAPVEMMGESMDKFLKPFDLK